MQLSIVHRNHMAMHGSRIAFRKLTDAEKARLCLSSARHEFARAKGLIEDRRFKSAREVLQTAINWCAEAYHFTRAKKMARLNRKVIELANSTVETYDRLPKKRIRHPNGVNYAGSLPKLI